MFLEGRLLGGRYRVMRRLGAGGMGVVFAALQEDLQRRVAIKVVAGCSPKAVERFRREALAAAELGHPNIVQVTDFQSNPGEPPFIVMEMLEGESLQTLLQREPLLPAERAAFIATQMLAALSAAHAAGIVHRDVKPANVFLMRTSALGDLVKVLDFGIAKFVRDGADTRGDMSGTPAYMAPEQVCGPRVDARADVYAVGGCLFEMLSGRRPFAGLATRDLLTALVCDPAPPLLDVAAWVDPRLAAIVDRALAKDPDARYPSALAMARDLAAVGRPPSSGDVAGLATVTQRDADPSPTHLTKRPRSRSLTTLLLAALVTGIVGLGAIGAVIVALQFTLGLHRPPPPAPSKPAPTAFVPPVMRTWHAAVRPGTGALVGDATEDVAGILMTSKMAEMSLQVVVLDGKTLAPAWMSAPKPLDTKGLPAIAVLGSRVVASTGTHDITIYDGATGAALRTADVPFPPFQICAPTDGGREVWLELQLRHEILLDVDTGATRPSTAPPRGCHYRYTFGRGKASVAAAGGLATSAERTELVIDHLHLGVLREDDLAVRSSRADNGDDLLEGFDARAKKRLWSRSEQSWGHAPRIVDLIGGRAFMQSEGTVEALDARTGHAIWKTSIPNTVRIYSVTVSPARIYVSNFTSLTILDADGKAIGTVQRL
jgi:serine/threonine-protein kinase